MKLRIAHILCVVFCFAASAFGAEAPNWKIEKFARSASGNRQFGIKVTADGVAHVVFTGCSDDKCKNNELFYAERSTDGKWATQSVDAERKDTGWMPSIAIDSTGTMHVAYTNHFKLEPYLRYATKAPGKPWSARKIGTDYGGYWTSMALNGDQLFIAHTAFPEKSSPAVEDINKPALELVTASLSKGTWNFEKLDRSVNAGWFTSLALDPNGLPAISYIKTYYLNGELTVMALGQDGKWNSMDVDSDVNKHSLQVDAQGFFHIAYDRRSEEFMTVRELWYATNAPDGNWKKELVDGRQYREANTGHFPVLKIDAKGGLHTIYEDAYHLRVMYARKLAGSKWETFQVTKTRQDGYYANLDIDANGTLHIVYDDGSTAYYGSCTTCTSN